MSTMGVSKWKFFGYKTSIIKNSHYKSSIVDYTHDRSFLNWYIYRKNIGRPEKRWHFHPYITLAAGLGEWQISSVVAIDCICCTKSQWPNITKLFIDHLWRKITIQMKLYKYILCCQSQIANDCLTLSKISFHH